VRYGEGAAADVRATDLHVRGLDGLTFKLHAPGRPGGPRDVSLPLVGRHFVTAALAAAAAAFEVGSDWEDVLAGLGRPPQTRRLAPRQLAGGIVLLDDAYNASPDSTCAALDVLAANGQPGGRRLAVLGDMLELGDYAPVAHRQVGLHVPGRAEVLIAVGTLAREIARAARIAGCPDSAVHECASASEAVSLLRQLLQNGDTVLVKASHGMHLEAVVEALGGGDGVSVHG
jgi:UDP-N-acetylmuramoyl-tripeptide--D-alanyl-D-alanine ligase